MTKKDLFKIILKLFGLYSIIQLILQIPNITYYLYLQPYLDFNWLIVGTPAIYLLMIFILIFKPDQIIKLFKLDQGFENQEVSNNSAITGKGITKIALIIIAVYLIVANIGGFVSQLIFSFKASVSRNSLDRLLDTFNPNPVDYQEMISTGISLVVGFLLLTNHTRFSNWIEKINNKNVVE